MIYAFVDTNIFVRIASQGRPGCELTHFESLKTLVQSRAVTLLVPEVLLLEVEKKFRTIPATSKKLLKQRWAEAASEILELLNSPHVEKIPFTQEVWLSAKKRLIAGRMPDPKKTSDQDAALIESLAWYLGKIEKPLFHFCSENSRDFAVECKSKDKQRIFALHPLLADGLPPTRYSVDLADLLSFAQGYEKLPIPTTADIERANALVCGVDDEVYLSRIPQFEEALYRPMAEQFAEHAESHFPAEVLALRHELATDIGNLLRELRACKSWDDKSELKLFSWIEHVPESLLPFTSLPKMIAIRDNLRRYLEIHQNQTV